MKSLTGCLRILKNSYIHVPEINALKYFNFIRKNRKLVLNMLITGLKCIYLTFI